MRNIKEGILSKPVSWRKSIILLLLFPIGLALSGYHAVAILTGLPIVLIAAYWHFESK